MKQLLNLVYVASISTLRRGEPRVLSPAKQRRTIAYLMRVARSITGLGLKFDLADEASPSPEAGWGWLPYLSFLAAISTLGLALTGNANRQGLDWAVGAYWLTLGFMFFCFAARTSWPAVSRGERLALILVLSAALYLAKVLISPNGFSNFDEFIHWITATNILERKRLFTPNAVLPISPFYPGLELVATAISQVSGLSIFAAGTILIGVTRLLCVATVFAIYERLTTSTRIAAVGTLLYMGHSNFFGFHSGFAYESLAIAFLALVLLMLASTEANSSRAGSGPMLLLSAMLFAALAVTHHLTSYVAAAWLIAYAFLEFIRADTPQSRFRALALAVIAVGAAYTCFRLVGRSTAGYLGPEVEMGFSSFIRLITGHAMPRELFVSEGGARLPLFMRVAGAGSAVILCAALAGGFFRTLQLGGLEPSRGVKAIFRWETSLLVLLTLITLAFPVALILRLSPMSWELGNRAGSILFFGVALVAAVAVHVQWIGHKPGFLRMGIVGILLALIFLGGIVAGGATSAIPSRYKVVADAPSVEPMGIEAAKWTKTWLGTNNRIVADRINRLLLTLYGRQTIVTTIRDKIDTSPLVVGKQFSDYERNMIKIARVDYLLVDLRLSQSLPGIGVYFEKGEPDEIHQAPPSPSALLKFNQEKAVNRLYDNGWIVLYDVRALRE